uniref:Uncharacterized protein n=1 Tax=Anguilla anguilla TaxID=7936 RepID=A0A0E9SV79_ANGAN
MSVSLWHLIKCFCTSKYIILYALLQSKHLVASSKNTKIFVRHDLPL